MVSDASEARSPPRWRWTLHWLRFCPPAFLALTRVTVDELPRLVAPCEAALPAQKVCSDIPHHPRAIEAFLGIDTISPPKEEIMRPSYRPESPPQPQAYRTQVLDHLGLVAGMFEELGITEGIDRAPKQDPDMRIVTAGHAVKAMVLNGLGLPCS